MPIAAALAASLTLSDRATVALASPVVRVGDVATGAGPIARVVIAKVPGGRTVTLSRPALAALIRRAIPGAVIAGTARPGVIAFRGPAIVRRTPAVVRLADLPAVKTGDRLTLISRAGPVTVERSVTALQPGRGGRRLFVRDDAGHVSSIPFVGERAR